MNNQSDTTCGHIGCGVVCNPEHDWHISRGCNEPDKSWWICRTHARELDLENNHRIVTTLFKIGGIQIRKIIIPARTIILKK